MIPVEEYLKYVLDKVKPLEPQVLPVSQCLGCVLAEELPARYAVPPFTNSSMDGYAVRSADIPKDFQEGDSATGPANHGADEPADDCCTEDTPHAYSGFTLPVVGDIPAGDCNDYVCEPGQALRIMTGARLPEGADCVVKVEDTDQPAGAAPLPSEVTIYDRPQAGQNVRYAAEDVGVGDVILEPGEVLTAAALSSAVSVGYDKLKVYPRPRVAVISTGSELKAPGEPLKGAQIPDSNSVLIEGLASRQDCEVVGIFHADDDIESYQRTLSEAADKADVIITSGGVSAGAFDVVKEAGQAADMFFTRVAMQPGKPQGCGITHDSQGHDVFVAMLPGNPVSVFVSFHMFVRPVLKQLTGRNGHVLDRTIAATATTAWKSTPGRRQFVPVQLQDPQRVGDTPTATPTHRLGSKSHLVASLHLANGLAIIPEEAESVEAWSIIDVMRV